MVTDFAAQKQVHLVVAPWQIPSSLGEVMEIESVDDLKTAIQGIVVKDYGDFKRKAVLYLNRFAELRGPFSETVERRFHRLKWHIQYHPSGDLEATRMWTLNQLDAIVNIAGN